MKIEEKESILKSMASQFTIQLNRKLPTHHIVYNLVENYSPS